MNMKTILFLMLALVLPGTLNAAPIKMDPDLKSPSVLSNPGSPPAEGRELRELLHKGDLNQFYGVVENLYKNYGKDDEATMTKDQIVKELWFFYYIAATPAGQQNLNNPEEDAPPFVDMALDIDLKSRAFQSLVYLYHPHVAQELKVRKREADALISSYCAAYFKQLRAVLENGFNDKFPTVTDVFGEDIKRSQWEARCKYRSMYLIAQRRNITAKFNLKFMEKQFMEKLVENFPGKKADVIKYIRMAGYQDDEIGDLVDRTVGREAKTEFLYKGRNKKGKR